MLPILHNYSSSGEAATDENSDVATMIINIIIPAEQEEEFNTAIVEGTLRVGRYLYDYNSEEDSTTDNGK